MRTTLLPQTRPEPGAAPRTLVIYHGTRADPAKLRAEGLRIPDVGAVFEAMEAMREDLGIAPPPRWVIQLAQDRVRSRMERPCVHLTFSREQAVRYSMMGGELMVELAEFLMWRRYSPYRYKRPERITAARDAFYDFIRGKDRWVVTVEIPWGWLPSRMQTSYLWYIKQGYDPTQTGWDICIDRDIPPHMIRAIEPVEE